MSVRSADSLKRYHLTGIGGAGMCGLAQVLLQQGCRVSGSDLKPSAAIDALCRAGAQVVLMQDGRGIPEATEVVVASLAVAELCPELVEARRRGLEVIRYPEAVGRLMADKRGLCIAGTHGKTTVTAAVAFGLEHAHLDPTFIVGGDVPQLGERAHWGRGEWMIVEACEYQRAFLAYRPEIAVITNVEAEHLDYYRDEADVVDAFAGFAAQVSPQGLLVVCAQSANALAAAEHARCDVETYAVGAEADWIATLVEGRPERAAQRFRLQHRGCDMGYMDLALPGVHNVANATAVVAVARRIGLDLEEVRDVMLKFRGAARRFEVVGCARGITVVDDFAHHPTEVRALLDTARREFPGRRLVCVFQPHQHSRTRAFLDDFANVLARADVCIVAPIYEARDTEDDRRAVSAADVAAQATVRGGCVRHAASFDEVEAALENELRDGDVLLTVGAGDVWKIAKRIVRRLQRDHSN